MRARSIDAEVDGHLVVQPLFHAKQLNDLNETQANKIELLKEMARAWGLNPEQILTREALTRPYATIVGPASCEEEQIKNLSIALKDMMRKELLNAKDNP